jgi:hypothetical protein
MFSVFVFDFIYLKSYFSSKELIISKPNRFCRPTANARCRTTRTRAMTRKFNSPFSRRENRQQNRLEVY